MIDNSFVLSYNIKNKLNQFYMINFLRKPLVVVILAIVILLVGLGIYKNLTKKPKIEFVEAKYQDVIQEVSLTGRVKPAEDVNLAFESSGKVANISVKVDDRVLAGTVLAFLQNGDLQAQVLQAEANLAVEQARLDEIKKGTRLEEIQKTQTAVDNAKSNLSSVKDKADADIESDYDGALTALKNSVINAKNALLTLTDIQEQYFSNNSQDSLNLANYKSIAVNSLLGLSNAGTLSSENLSRLNGGVFGFVHSISDNSERTNIDSALVETLKSLNDLKNALGSVPVLSTFSATQKTNLSTEKTTISSEIITMSSNQQAIAVQKVTNANNISSAENSLRTAEDDLSLKKAGSTEEQIKAQDARVDSASATVKSAKANLTKTIIISPISGLITEQEAKVGEIVNANTSVISLIADVNFEIETNAPEADVAKLKIGDSANITLDAYGNDKVFFAKIVSINPAETIIDGVATYKTTLQFIEDDEKIKSGMTANIDVLTDKKVNVLAIPARAVIVKENKKIVKILEENNIIEKEVEVGLRGSYGNIEILSGINEGDKVILFIGE